MEINSKLQDLLVEKGTKYLGLSSSITHHQSKSEVQLFQLNEIMRSRNNKKKIPATQVCQAQTGRNDCTFELKISIVKFYRADL